MTDTRLLNYIRNEMKNQGVVWKKEQELFEMLIPNEVWKKHKSNWSTWKNEKVDDLRKSPHIRLAIQQTLGFSADIWEASDKRQKQAVVEGVQKSFVQKNERLPEWNNIIPTFMLSAEQEELLVKIEKLSFEKIETLSSTHPQCFTRTFPNQAFLLELLELLYKKGAYDILIEKVFPNLLSHQRADTNIKIMEAHTLGSLKEPKYMQSVKLLESIKSSDENKVIDLKTSMLSNLRRYYAKSTELTREQLLEGMGVMSKNYHDLFVYTQRYHYYPAINLLYVERVRDALLESKSTIDFQDVYKKAKISIEEEKKSTNVNAVYYAYVTELEFLLLLGRKEVRAKMGLMLETLMPSVVLVQRTKRQMLEFVEMVERVEAKLPELVTEFQKVIELLEDYEKQW